MLRRTFLKACSTLAAIPLLPSFMRDVKRVILTYESETLSFKERAEQFSTFNDRPLAGVEPGGMFCRCSGFETRFRDSHPYFHATVIYERIPRNEEIVTIVGVESDIVRVEPIIKRADPILRSMRLIKQEVEYA